jgi:hypothetical protein
MAEAARARQRSPVRVVNIHDLKVYSGAEGYQRPLKRYWVRWLAQNWDWPSCDLLVLSEHADGSLWILAGQHRVEALKLRGESEAPAYVMYDLAPQQEAKIYVGRNTHKATTTLEMFKGRLHAGEPNAVAVNKIAEENGFKMTGDPHTDPVLRAASAVEAVHAWGVLPDALSTIQAVWGNRNQAAVAGNLILGLGALFRAYSKEDGIDRSRLVSRLRGLDPTELVNSAHMQARYAPDHRVWAMVARHLVAEYNKGAGKRLPEPVIPKIARRLWLTIKPEAGRGRMSQKRRAVDAR